MTKSAETQQIKKKLDAILARLLEDSHGDRTTIRIDDESRGWNVNFVCAEAVRPGVKSLRSDGSINQRAADTVKWLVKNNRNLVQPDIVNSPDPAPPPALMSAYAAKAQMLAPLCARDAYLAGWISVHYLETHEFTDDEIAALDRASEEVKLLTGIGS